MKWWPVLDSELDISVQDDNATSVTDNGDDGEGSDLKGTMGKESMELVIIIFLICKFES